MSNCNIYSILFPVAKGSASHKDTHTHTQTKRERLAVKKRSILCGALVRVLLLADTAAYIIDVYGYPTTHRHTQTHTHTYMYTPTHTHLPTFSHSAAVCVDSL